MAPEEVSDSGSSEFPATPATKRKKLAATAKDLDSSFEDPVVSGGERDLLNPPKRRGRGRPETTEDYRVIKTKREARAIREEMARDREMYNRFMNKEFDPPLSRKIAARKETFVEKANGAAVSELAAAVGAEMRAIHRATAASRNLKGSIAL